MEPERQTFNLHFLMKKNLLLILGLILVTSFAANAKKVELAQAKIAGKNFFFERINTKEAVAYQAINLSSEFIAKSGNEAVYYVFSINNRGFVIVSAEDACHPILGYSFDQNFDPALEGQNFINWMNHYKEEIELIRQNNYEADEDIQSSWAYYTQNNFENFRKPGTISAVEPLLKSIWNQDYPYNALCPADINSTGSYSGHVPVGCTATALSQIMLYWRWPNTGSGYHCDIHPYQGQQLCADFGNTTYLWDGMSNGTGSECYQAALISYHTGIAVNMDYGVNGSGAPLSIIPYALSTYFKYATSEYVTRSSYNNNSWAVMLKAELDAGRPVEYAGFEPSTAGGGGHAFVCDGYQGGGSYSDYFHFNWGWGGYADGYFYLSNLNPGSSSFNVSQQAVINIRPDAALYPIYCSGNKEVTTYNFGTLDDGSGPLNNYQPNSNCSWLIGPDDSIQSVTLSFLRFDLDAGDELKIYNGSNASAPLLATYTGNTLPPAVTTTSPQMFVTLTSGSSGSAQGFLANYNCTPFTFCSANTILTDPNGSISDGSGRFDYRNNTSCKWKIQPENATSVTIVFNAFNTEAENDKLSVVDLGPPAVVIATLSGDHSSQLPDPVTAPSGKMMLMWNTNKSIRNSGWDLSYTITVGTPEDEIFNNLSIFPNPATDKLNLAFSSDRIQQVTIEFITLKGETLFAETLPYFKGNYSKSLNVSDFSKGIYLLRLTSDKGRTIKKIVLN